MSGLYGNPCVPEQSSSTSNRYEKASHREWADMLGRIGTPVQGDNMKGNSLGNRLRRKDILPPFRMFYSLAQRRRQGFCAQAHAPENEAVGCVADPLEAEVVVHLEVVHAGGPVPAELLHGCD